MITAESSMHAVIEISRKFELEDIESMLLDSGFDLVQHNQAEMNISL